MVQNWRLCWNVKDGRHVKVNSKKSEMVVSRNEWLKGMKREANSLKIQGDNEVDKEY